MTTSKIYQKMRKNARGQYLLLSFCAFLSVLLITAFALMYFGPTVQNFLPEGGDTRKMASLLLAATALGCFIFTLYASSMFFRYKSREYGILMALGLEKKNLRRLLFKELSVITAAASLAGLLCAVPVSYLIWKLFELFIISNEQMTYRFGAAGFLPGILFAACLALMLGLAARRFINKSDIMDILRTQHKTQMVKTVKGWILPVGIVLMFLGVALGSGLPQVAAQGLQGQSAFCGEPVLSPHGDRHLPGAAQHRSPEPCGEKQGEILQESGVHQSDAFYSKGIYAEYVRHRAADLCLLLCFLLRNAVQPDAGSRKK